MQATTSNTPVEAVTLVKIDNLAIYHGTPKYLLSDQQGKFAIGHEGQGQMVLESPWIDLDAAAETALRVAGGDAKMMTHPKTMLVLATAILAFFALAMAPKPAEGKPDV